MSDATIALNNYKTQLEASIVTYEAAGRPIPTTLLERLSWTQEILNTAEGGGDASAANQLAIKALLETEILNALNNVSISTDSVNLNTDTLEALITALSEKLPTTLGQKDALGSLSVVLASDNPNQTVSVNNFPNTQPVSVATLPLPSGAASETTLTAVASRLPGTLGQKASSGSLSVVVASDNSLSIGNFPTTQAISAVTLPLPSGAASEVTLSTFSGKFPATIGQKTNANSLAVALASDTSININNFPATQAITAGALPLPSGAATETTVGAISGKLPTTLGQKNSAASLSITPASDATIAVSNFPATQGITATSLPLPSGAATEVTSTAISNKLPSSLGQKTSANSLAVVLASDVTSTVAINNFPATQAVSATELPLPTGAATQATLATISGFFGALADAASATGSLFARLRTIAEALTSRTNRVDRSGTTSVNASTWTTAITANTNRKFWRLHNPITNIGDLEVGYLIGASNIRTVILLPGATIEESIPSMDVSPQAIVVRSTTASLPFDAVEA